MAVKIAKLPERRLPPLSERGARDGRFSLSGMAVVLGGNQSRRMPIWKSSAYARAMKEILARRIIEMAQRGTTDQQELVAGATRFIATNYRLNFS